MLKMKEVIIMDLSLQQKIAENIKALRNLFSYTQEQISTLIHTSRSSYALYESGKKVPNTELLISLAEVYNITVDTIISLDLERLNRDISIGGHYKKQFERLADLFFELSPVSRGCLLERAEMLCEEERRKLFNKGSSSDEKELSPLAQS
jgi:transcriptional regulator with XRE-family HTH domain